MDRIGVVGITYRQGGPEAVARFTLPVEGRSERVRALARAVGASEMVYLATCNRVEVAFAAEPHTSPEEYRRRIFSCLAGAEAGPGEAEHTFSAWVGEGAAEHLFLVAAGLESARVGETEIAGQFRDALNLSREAGLCGPRLGLVLDEALKAAARVHNLAQVANGRTSLAEIAIGRAKRRLEATGGKAVLVGVSPMTQRCARALADAGHPVIIANRSVDRAERLAAQVGGAARALDEFRRSPDPVEVVILATAATEPVLGQSELERLRDACPSGQAPLVIDLAVPPDVDPEGARAAGVPRFGMDEVLAEADATRGHRLVEMGDARTLIDEALVGLRRRMASRMLGPLLAAVQRRYRETADWALERLFRRELKDLGVDERERVREVLHTLARRMAHVPCEGLKGVAFEKGLGAVEAFVVRADEVLARELERVDNGTGRTQAELEESSK